MKRSLLITSILAAGLILGGCSSRSIGNSIDDPCFADARARSWAADAS